MTNVSNGSLLKLGCDNIGRSPYFAVSLQRSNEVVLDGKEGCRCSRGDVNLVVDVLDVVVDGLLGDREQAADCLTFLPLFLGVFNRLVGLL